MRPRLPLGIDAPAHVLDNLRRRAEPSIRADGQHRHAPAPVVRDQEMPASIVQAQMARAGAHRRALIQQLQHPRCRIDRERADGASRLAVELVELVDRKEQAPDRVEFEKRWIRSVGRHAERDQGDVLRDRETLRLQPEKIDTLALCSSGVGADVHERFIQHGDGASL
jgi:hypothetical protein